MSLTLNIEINDVAPEGIMIIGVRDTRFCGPPPAAGRAALAGSGACG